MLKYQYYANEINHYELEHGYSLQRADNQEFVKSWVVYRNVNEDFAQSYTEIQKELTGVNFCFWIMLNDKRVGGAVMLPNGIGDLFLIPPEEDATKILSIVLPLLEYWSDDAKAIGAQAISPDCLDAFQQVGFIPGDRLHQLSKPAAP